MDPTTTCCPDRACPARGQTGQGNIGIHSRKDRRFICTQCRKTFAATYGTVLYRLRTAGDLVALILTLLAHGCPVQAMVVAFGFDERTVAAWGARAGRQGQAVQEHLVEQPRDLAALERAGTYRGLYHVLHGRLAPLENMGPEQLTIDGLLKRVQGGTVQEVIMATNPTLEGDGTALFLSNLLAATGVKITRLARGLPSGSVLEFANNQMLADALEGRRTF